MKLKVLIILLVVLVGLFGQSWTLDELGSGRIGGIDGSGGKPLNGRINGIGGIDGSGGRKNSIIVSDDVM